MPKPLSTPPPSPNSRVKYNSEVILLQIKRITQGVSKTRISNLKLSKHTNRVNQVIIKANMFSYIYGQIWLKKVIGHHTTTAILFGL